MRERVRNWERIARIDGAWMDGCMDAWMHGCMID